MNSLLLYDYVSRCGVDHPRRVLVVFNSVTPPAAEVYEARLCEFLADRRTPDILYFVGNCADLKRYESLLESEVLLSRVEAAQEYLFRQNTDSCFLIREQKNLSSFHGKVCYLSFRTWTRNWMN